MIRKCKSGDFETIHNIVNDAARTYKGIIPAKYGFQLVSAKEKDRLLNKYWNIPLRQVETSVVLADSKWWHWKDHK